MKLSVYLNTYGIRRMVGLLYENAGRVFFEYSPDFLQSGIALSPFKLPLKPGVFEDEKRTFDGLFGLFNDSLPDGWGRLLLDRILLKNYLDPYDIDILQCLAITLNLLFCLYIVHYRL